VVSSVDCVFGIYTTSTSPQYFSFFNNVISPGDAYFTTGAFNSGTPAGVAGVVVNDTGAGNVYLCNDTVSSGNSSSAGMCFFSSAAIEEVHNNIFIMRGASYGIWSAFDSTQNYKNNCFYKSGTGAYVNVQATEYTVIESGILKVSAGGAALANSSGNIAENPLFTSESGRDYSLTSSTPASVRSGGTNGIGDTHDWFSYNDDITGTLRPSSGGWSMGAYQY